METILFGFVMIEVSRIYLCIVICIRFYFVFPADEFVQDDRISHQKAKKGEQITIPVVFILAYFPY